MSLDAGLEALDDAVALGEDRLSDADLTAMRGVLERAGQRRSLSGDHTVVGFFGATGSGKSSLFNAVVGQDLATAHVRRPTTSVPLAAVWHPDGASALLDWLEIDDRRHMETPFADNDVSLILLDLPDFDSVESSHREVAEKLAGKVDVLVWVVDPQKYADAVIHRDFIAPLASHAAVTAAVLNQVDKLAADDVPGVVDSLRHLLRRDGLGDVLVFPTSATTGEGVAAVRAMIARFAGERKATSDRLAADIRNVTEHVAAPDIPPTVAKVHVEQLHNRLAAAARVDVVANAVAASYRKRAGQVTGWPLTAWLLRLRPDPLRRLHLATSKRSDADLHRTALPEHSAAQRAQASQAVRGYADAAAEGLSDGWRAAVRERANQALDTLPAELDRALAGTNLGARGSWWWVIIAIVQWIAVLAALTGVGWYLAAAFFPMWNLPTPEILEVEGWQVPTLLIAAGILLGIVLGLLSAALGGLVAAVRKARAHRRLRKSIAVVADREVVEPIEHERDRAEAFGDAVRRARASASR